MLEWWTTKQLSTSFHSLLDAPQFQPDEPKQNQSISYLPPTRRISERDI